MNTLPWLTPDIADKMPISIDGCPSDNINADIALRHMALATDDNDCFALIRHTADNTMLIEALEGVGGMALAREIVEIATTAGIKCEAWVFSGGAREKLARRLGMLPTGQTRLSYSGKTQIHVRTV